VISAERPDGIERFTNAWNRLKSEPDWSQLPAETPRDVITLLRRSLETDSSHRLSSIGDSALTLEESTRMPESSLVPPTSQVQNARCPTASPTKTPLNWRWPVAAGLFILVGGAGVFFWQRSGSDRHPQTGSDAGLGDLDPAFVWLERGVESRDLDPRAWWEIGPLTSLIC
jgi:hypothetical protein